MKGRDLLTWKLVPRDGKLGQGRRRWKNRNPCGSWLERSEMASCTSSCRECTCCKRWPWSSGRSRFLRRCRKGGSSSGRFRSERHLSPFCVYVCVCWEYSLLWALWFFPNQIRVFVCVCFCIDLSIQMKRREREREEVDVFVCFMWVTNKGVLSMRYMSLWLVLTYVAVAAVQDKLLNGPFLLEVFFFFFRWNYWGYLVNCLWNFWKMYFFF